MVKTSLPSLASPTRPTQASHRPRGLHASPLAGGLATSSCTKPPVPTLTIAMQPSSLAYAKQSPELSKAREVTVESNFAKDRSQHIASASHRLTMASDPPVANRWPVGSAATQTASPM